MASEIKVDTISEKTSANGIAIDSVTLKDGGATLTAPLILADGSASAPTITNTGDTNCGLLFSAADTMAFSAGGTSQFTMADGVIAPVTDNDVDLGTSSLEFKDGYFDGTLYCDTLNLAGTNHTSISSPITALNNATANELVTVGSTTTELDAESGLTYTDGALVIGGTTPSLTIGDAGAEDTKVVFDGNAQDYHIGLDDSSDKLGIGLGSALGTTTHMSFDSTGAILKPLQPSFVITPSANSADIAADTTHTIVFDTEVIDRNGDWDGTNTFTAPVTGLYLFTCTVLIGDYDHDNNYSALFINTSNRRWSPWQLAGSALSVDGGVFINGSVIADMDASDTMTFQFRNDQGTQQPHILQEFSFASGMLLG